MGVRVVVAEDNYLIREGIRALLDADDELELVADAASLPALLDAVALFDGGARGRAYLLKERVGDLGQLRHAIHTVTDGGTVLDPIVVDALVAPPSVEASRPGRVPSRLLHPLATLGPTSPFR